MIGDTARAHEQLDAQKLNGASNNLCERRPHENTSNRCKLPELPRELRDLIYHYTAFFHIRDVGIGQTPGLLRASEQATLKGQAYLQELRADLCADRQLRWEFSDTLYISKLLSLRYYDHGKWQTSRSSSLLRALLECSNRMVVDFAGRLLGTSRDQAERLAEFNSKHVDPSAVAGSLELVGTHGRSCINVAFARTMIEAYTDKSSDPDSAEDSLKRSKGGALGSRA